MKYQHDIDIIQLSEWRQKVREGLLEAKAEMSVIDERYKFVSAEYDRLIGEQELIEQAGRAYNARIQQPSKRTPVAGGNLREVIIINYAHENGLVVGKDVSTGLFEEGYFTDRRTADGAVYTVLNRSPFVKNQRGIYVIPTESPDWIRLRGTNGHKSLWRKQLDAVMAETVINHGHIRSGEVTNLLKRLGLYSNPKSIGLAANSVLKHLVKQRKLHRAERGHYRATSQNGVTTTPRLTGNFQAT